MNKKMRDSRGETLVEVLASIVVASLSVALLFGGVMASTKIDRTAEELDEAYYKALSEAEKQETPLAVGACTVRIENRNNGMTLTLPVSLYGGEGTFSYSLDKGGIP